MADNKIKIVFVGDSNAGKTSVIRRYHVNKFEESYSATTTYDRYEKFHRFEDQGYNLIIEDTAGQSVCGKLRPLQYTNADVFVICFALADDSKDGLYFHFSSATDSRVELFWENAAIFPVKRR